MRQMTVSAAATAVLAMLVAAPPARAFENCISVCDNPYCTVTHEHCIETGPPPPAYGAIAYSVSTGSWGSAYHWSSREEAERVAVKNCAKFAKDCKAVVWFENWCGALSTDSSSDAYGWNSAATLPAARAGAQSECAKNGGNNCKVLAALCSR
jgi:hypothetical protein